MSFIERLKQRTQQRFADAERRVLERRQQQAPAPTPPAPQRPAGIQQLLKAFQPTIEAMRPITEPLAEIARPIVEPIKTPSRIRIRTKEEQREAQADNWFARMLMPKRVERTGNILQDTLANVQRGLETPAARAVMEPFVAISKGAGGVVTGDIIPRRGETPREFYKRQPQLGEVVSRELDKTGIPVLPIVGGFLAEALLPPYGVGGAGRFADDIIKATTLNAKENIIKKGIKGITNDEATTLARTLTPIKNKRTVQRRLDDFVRAKQQARAVTPTPEVPPARAITPPTPVEAIREKARVGVVPPLEVPPAVGVMTPEAPLVRNIDLPLEKIDHIKPPTKRPPSLEKLGLRKKPDLITRPEDVLLRERIRAQARGAKEAAKAGRVLTRDALRLKREGHEKAITELRDVNKKVVQSLKDETKNIAQKKQAIVDYAKDKLPLDLRGKLISAVSRATSEGDVASAVRRINILRNEEIKKDVVKNIEDIIKNIDALPPNQQRRILEETEGITLSSFSPETQKKLGELKDFISQKPEAVYRFGAKTIKKAERTLELGKIPLKEVPLRDIINKSNRLSFVLEEGKLMNKITGRIKDLKVQNALREVAESNPVNLDRGLPPPRKPGDPIPMTSFSGVRDDTIEAMRKGTQYYVSPDVGFSIFDNDVLFGKVWQTFKHPADLATDLTNKMRNKTIDDLFENVKNIEAKHGKLKVENYENVTLYAALRQTGGRAKLQKSDPRIFTDTFLDSIKLSDGEMEFYNLGRSIFDELRPQIEDVLWKTRGEKLGKVDNYWSWMTDFENSDELFMRLSGDYNLTSRTAQGFTKSRVLGASDRINLNALDVLVKHINDASMFIHQEELLNHLGKIARSDEFTKSVGEMGQRWTLGWIDLLSRGGTPKGYRPGPLTQVIHNIGHGVLGFRLSPVVKQPLAKVVSYSYLGNTLNIDKEFFTNPSIRDALHKISAQQKYRSFDDPAYTALAKNKRLVDWQKKGYQAIKTVDSYMADSVWYAAYRTNLEKRKIAFNLEDFRNGKNIDDKAKIYADYVVRRTQGSSEFKDAPLMYATQANRDSVIALLQFQRFVHNQSMLWRDAKTALIKEKDPIKAASISTALVAAGLANSYITTGMAQIFSSEDTAKREREKAISRRFFDAIVGQIPVVSNIVSVAEFEGTGIPVADVLRRGVLESPKMFTAETPEARMRAATRVAESAAIIGGISGAGQAGQIVRRLIPAPRKAPRRGPLSMPSLRMPRTELPSLKLPRQ